MNGFHNILFVSHGVTDETEALKQALSLARNNKALLHALVVCPALPKEMAEYTDKYTARLKQQLDASLQAARESVKVAEHELPVEIAVDCGSTPTIRIIRHVLKQRYDLVIKQAQPLVAGKGFQAIDMELLRKCPVPVWLTRPIEQHRHNIRVAVAVAVDPQSGTPEGHDLNLNLLTLARSLADTCDGELRIVSCWNYPYEHALRGNVWIRISEEEIKEAKEASRASHLADLERLVSETKIAGTVHTHHLHGVPDEAIPHFVTEQKIDILVMGTVARTGIHSFVMGNTAENILQKLSCSLLALKPNGFISPVRLY